MREFISHRHQLTRAAHSYRRPLQRRGCNKNKIDIILIATHQIHIRLWWHAVDGIRALMPPDNLRCTNIDFCPFSYQKTMKNKKCGAINKQLSLVRFDHNDTTNESYVGTTILFVISCRFCSVRHLYSYTIGSGNTHWRLRLRNA